MGLRLYRNVLKDRIERFSMRYLVYSCIQLSVSFVNVSSYCPEMLSIFGEWLKKARFKKRIINLNACVHVHTACSNH